MPIIRGFYTPYIFLHTHTYIMPLSLFSKMREGVDFRRAKRAWNLGEGAETRRLEDAGPPEGMGPAYTWIRAKDKIKRKSNKVNKKK